MTMDRSRAASSALWSLLENGGLALISLGTLVVYARLLSAAEFGLFAVVLALVELLQVLVTMLFHDALVQRKAVTEAHFDTAFTFGLLLSLGLGAACVAVAPWFARAVSEPRAAAVLCGMTPCFPAAALSATLVARQRRELSFRPLAVRSLIGRFAGAGLGVVLIVLGAGVWGLVAQQVLIQAVGSAVLWQLAEQRPRLRMARRELGELARFGLPAIGTLLLVFGTKRVFAVLTGMFLGVEVAGYLNLSFRVVDVFWSIAATAATQVALPAFAELQADFPRLRSAFQLSTRVTSFVLYGCFVGLGMVAPEVVRVVFGAKWLVAAPYVSVLSFLVLLQGARVLVPPLLTALGRPRELLLCKALELGFVVVALFSTRVPTIGWAIGIWVGRELLALPLTAALLGRVTGLSLLAQLRGAAVPLLAASAMVAVLVAARHILEPRLGPITLLLVLIPIGALAFFRVAFVLDRALVRSMVALVARTLGRPPRPDAPDAVVVGTP